MNRNLAGMLVMKVPRNNQPKMRPVRRTSIGGRWVSKASVVAGLLACVSVVTALPSTIMGSADWMVAPEQQRVKTVDGKILMSGYLQITNWCYWQGICRNCLFVTGESADKLITKFTAWLMLCANFHAAVM